MDERMLIWLSLFFCYGHLPMVLLSYEGFPLNHSDETGAGWLAS